MRAPLARARYIVLLGALVACRTNEALSNRIVGLPTLVAGGTTWTRLNDGVAGSGSCALASGGAAFCWAVSLDHALTVAPYTAAGGVTFTAISVGWQICALATTGAAYCWDPNAGSFLPVSGGLTFSSMSTACGLTAAGSAYCWTGTGTPQIVAGAPPLVALSSGISSTCGLDATGAAYCWGDNTFGQLGATTPLSTCYPPFPIGRPCSSSTAPLAVAGGLTFTSISAGGAHTCGLTAGGSAYCWGSNDSNQLGVSSRPLSECGITALRATKLVPDSVACTAMPTAVAGGFLFTTISSGGAHTCGLVGDGAAYCWGANDYGQLGNGSTTPSDVPVPVSRGLRFTSINAASDHTCALTADGHLYCWGGTYCGSGPGGKVISCGEVD